MDTLIRDVDSRSASVTLADEAISQEAEVNIQQVLTLYNKLSVRTDLEPCTAINAIFGELVGLCIQTLSQEVTRAILENERIQEVLPDLRRICALAECYLESHWADLISRGASTREVQALLNTFPYYSNYVDLTRLELSALRAVNPTPPQKIAFIGSGPMPLTSLCLLNNLNPPKSLFQSLVSWFLPKTEATVMNIDHNAKAIDQSRQLCSDLGSTGKCMRFHHGDACAITDLRDYDVVYLAALVGCGQIEKEAAVQRIVAQMREGALVIIRTSWGLRGLLYPEFDCTTEAILSILDICVVVHPYDHVVNSVIVARVKSRA